MEIWEAYNAGDLIRAQAAQNKANAVVDAILSFGYLAGMKAVAGMRLGIDCGAPRPPGSPLTAEQTEILREKVAALGLSILTAGVAGD